MRIQILGTAAAEAWPAVFCGCDTCVRARAAGGPNFRSRASLQIDDIYKIDMGPDTYSQSVRFGVDLSALAYLFFTHSHADHLDLVEFEWMRPPFAHNLKNAPVRVYGNEAVTSAIRDHHGEGKLPIELNTIQPFIPIEAGNLTFTPITAHHNPDELCLNYIIQSDAATVLYSSDTGEYDQPTIDFLQAQKHFDLLIIECTQGCLPMPAIGHMSFEAVLRLREKIVSAGAADKDVRTVITHFSHNMGLLHDEFEAIANPHGVEVAYDGIVLEV